MGKKISIIVPVYNVEKFLKKCIESIINQTYKNLEILLIDDGSIDSSGAICDEYAKKDDRIRVIHKPNGGISSTRNLGLEESTGEYITFIDSDDFVTEDFCETLYDMITKENCDIASVEFTMLREKGYKNVTNDDIKEIEEDSNVLIYNDEEILKQILLRKTLKNYLWLNLYKKEFLKNCKFKEGISYEDVLFSYEISKQVKKVAYVNKKCYFYIKRSGSITAVCSEKNLNDFLDVVIYRYNDIKERGIVDEKYNIFALLESIISISIKYVIANKFYESVSEKSKYIFEILKEYMSNSNNEIELLPLLTETQKAALYLLLYNEKLFYNFLSTRHNMKKTGEFV